MKVYRWEEYKKFFQITIFKYLVLWFSLVPIVAGLVEQLPSLIYFHMGNKIYPIDLTLPFKWQLLWISSFFFVIALIIYAVRCPRFIHNYNTYKDYQAFSHDARWMSWEASYLIAEADEKQKDKLIERLTTKMYLTELTDANSFIASSKPQVEEKQTVLYFEHKNKKYKLGMPVLNGDGIVSDSEKGVFFELFGRYSESRKTERTVILILLVLSLISFSIVLAQHLWSGSGFVFCWIKGLV
jgi:hypothetical protein